MFAKNGSNRLQTYPEKDVEQMSNRCRIYVYIYSYRFVRDVKWEARSATFDVKRVVAVALQTPDPQATWIISHMFYICVS